MHLARTCLATRRFELISDYRARHASKASRAGLRKSVSQKLLTMRTFDGMDSILKKGILDTDKDGLTRIKKIICFACGEEGDLASGKRLHLARMPGRASPPGGLN